MYLNCTNDNIYGITVDSLNFDIYYQLHTGNKEFVYIGKVLKPSAIKILPSAVTVRLVVLFFFFFCARVFNSRENLAAFFFCVRKKVLFIYLFLKEFVIPAETNMTYTEYPTVIVDLSATAASKAPSTLRVEGILGFAKLIIPLNITIPNVYLFK